MQIAFSFKKLGEFDQHFCRQYLEQKVDAITRALPRLGPDAEVSLDVRVERFAKKKAFKVSMHLRAGARTWMAEEDDHTLREAIDLSKDKLVLQMRKHHRVEGTMQQ
ncbi:HPF/RaiA family ribosome-associated protein [Candidatus Uhrbacteria bacterium]|nr:HPF/RaiA family ribosome-associated protein [Candidatus Uhrbacteria bacterium]